MYIESQKSLNITNVIVLLIFSLIIIGTTNSMSGSISRIGLVSLSTILITTNLLLIYYLSIKKEVSLFYFWIIATSFLFFVINILGLYNNLDIRSLITLFQFVALLGFFAFFSLFEWSQFKIKIVRKLSILFLSFLFIHWILSGFPTLFSSIYPNPNLIGIYSFLMLFFILLDKNKTKWNFIFIILSMLLIYASGSRSVYLAVGLSLVTYWLWPLISKYTRRMFGYILLVFAGIFTFTFIYPNLIKWSNFQAFNDFIQYYTGKNIYSGREVLWSQLTDIISSKPFLGHGTGTLTRDVLDAGISAHNLYLQIALQNGYIGLFIFVILLIIIWLIFFYNKNNHIVRLTASFFTGILLYQTFEVTLIQNQIAVAIIMWLIFAIGVSKTAIKKI